MYSSKVLKIILKVTSLLPAQKDPKDYVDYVNMSDFFRVDYPEIFNFTTFSNIW